MVSKRPRHLRLVKPPSPVHYSVIGVEYERKKAYFQAYGPFASPLEALHFRGAAKEVHGYQAYERYHAVAVYADGGVYELTYQSFTTAHEDARPFRHLYPTFSSARLGLPQAHSR